MSDRTDEDSEWEMESDNDWIETAEINHANQAMHKIELQEQGADWRQTFERTPFVCKVVSFMAGDGYSLPLPSLLVWRTLSSADREAADNAASNTPIVAHVDLSFSVFGHHHGLTMDAQKEFNNSAFERVRNRFSIHLAKLSHRCRTY